MTKIKYENRIVLFLDVLGFKFLLNKVEKENNPSFLYDILIGMSNKIESKKTSTKQITQFSDSIIISFEENEPEQIFELFDEIQKIIIYLIYNGIICRGAISYGELVHTDKVLFGPALVDAYETESKAAMYPRVILDKSISDIGKNAKSFYGRKITNPEMLEFLSKYKLEKDSDEKYYIDYFLSGIESEKETEKVISYLKNLRTIIIEGAKLNKTDLKVKYGWMQNKYNQMLEKISEIGLINYPILHLNEEVKKYLNKLDKI